MQESTQHAKERLSALLSEMGSCAVAFSGGVDSSLLLACAHEVLGGSCVALTLKLHSVASTDIEECTRFCAKRGIEHHVIELDELSIAGFADNPPERCYICKRAIFGELQAKAKQLGLALVVEGSNLDDKHDWRPGMRALNELGVRSPLREAGFTKAAIRELSQEMGLPSWNKPSAACLSSRIPYGEHITAEKLSRVEKAEAYLHGLGFSQLRVRSHKDVARIEVSEAEIERLLDADLRHQIAEQLKALGFAYVSCDLLGFRSGSMNEVLGR